MYMWNVIFGRGVGVGGRGFGVDRDEQASVNRNHIKNYFTLYIIALDSSIYYFYYSYRFSKKFEKRDRVIYIYYFFFFSYFLKNLRTLIEISSYIYICVYQTYKKLRKNSKIKFRSKLLLPPPNIWPMTILFLLFKKM